MSHCGGENRARSKVRRSYAVQKRTCPVCRGGWKFGQRMERMKKREALTGRMGGNVNRILKAIFATALCGTLAGAGALLAQDAAKPDSAKKSGGSNSAAVARGKS